MTKHHTTPHRYLPLFLLGMILVLVATPASAELIQNSFFSVLTPPNNYQTSGESVVVAGKFAKPVDRITINGASAIIEKNSAFHLQVKVKKGEKNVFTVAAFDGKKQLRSDRVTVLSVNPSVENAADENTPDVVLATGGGKPSIQVENPANQTTDQNFVLIEGVVKDAVELRINNHRVPIFQGGRFVSKEPISQANVPTAFVIVARNKAGVEVSLKRVVTSTGASAGPIDTRPVVPAVETARPAVEKPKSLNKPPVITKSEPKPVPPKVQKPLIAAPMVKPAFEKPRPVVVTPAPRPVVPEPDREPVLTLLSPEPNFFSRVPRVMIKGQALYASKIIINGVVTPVDRSGRFYQVLPLPRPDKYFVIAIQAKSQGGKSVSATRKVFYQQAEMQFDAASVAGKPTPAPIGTAKSVAQSPAVVESAAPEGVTWIYPKNGTRTSASLIAVYGNVQPGTELEINDQAVPVQSDGKFKVELPVQSKVAENRIHLQATLPSGKVVDISRTVIFDAKSAGLQPEILAPRLSIFEPTPFGLTTKDSVFVTGKVENTTMLMINERRVVPKPDGLFSEKFALTTLGKVMFNIVAIGADGQTTAKSVQIMRKSPSIETELKARSSTSLQSQLNRRVSLELTDSPIKEVLKILAKKGDLNIVADKSLTGTVTISLNDLTIINAINLILNSQGLSYQIIDNTILVAPADALKSATTLETKVIYLKNIQSDRVEAIIKDRLAQSESIQTLAQDNVVIITADPKKLQQLTELIMRLDSVKTAQVVIEAQIIETSTSALEGLGVAWPSAVGGSLSLSKTDATTTVKAATSISAIVNLLESQGKAKILARPRIKAIDGQSANIFIGDKVPYSETNEDASGKITETIKFVDSGITLKILPTINTQDQEVKIKIEPEVSSIFGWRGKNNDVPWVKTRKVDTTVSVKNNETVVIGGLFNSSDSVDQSKVPFLGDIPFIGGFFTNNKTDQNLSQLVITITPRIIQSGESDYFPAEAK